MHYMEIFGTPKSVRIVCVCVCILYVNHTSSTKNINYWRFLLPDAEAAKIFPLF